MAAGEGGGDGGGGGGGGGGGEAGQVHVEALTRSQVAKHSCSLLVAIYLSIYPALLFLFSQPLRVILPAVAI